MVTLDQQLAEIDARALAGRLAPVEVVMIGHCPSIDGSAEWKRLARDAGVLAEIAALGFTAEITRLRALDDGTTETEPGDGALQALYRLPIPIRSVAYFQALFPQAFQTDGSHRSPLTGQAAWLPRAVADFFDGADPDSRGTRTLWIIRVPETDGVRAFLPRPDANLLHPSKLGAFERALLIERAGIIALPDLERLLMPATLPDGTRARQAASVPERMPCGFDDVYRGRRRSNELPSLGELIPPADLVSPIVRTLAALRPDMQCLLALPMAVRARDGVPGPSPDFLTQITQCADKPGNEDGKDAEKLRHLQLVWPYVRGPNHPLGSPCGLIAGMQARIAQRFGTWRSIAGCPLPGGLEPWPVVTAQQATTLREAPGVTMLLLRGGKLEVDSEAMCVPCLPATGVRRQSPEDRTQQHWRSAEVMRFTGWLRRELRTLGDQLVFDVDARDPRAELALRSFFDRLRDVGALRAGNPEDAYHIRKLPQSDSTLAFEIDIAPAYPIDRLRITFLHHRHATTADTRIEAVPG